MLLQILLNSEVSRDDLYLSPHSRNTFRLFPIRNRGFYADAVVRKGQEQLCTLMHRNYIFCLDQMSQPLHPVVRGRFINLDPAKVLPIASGCRSGFADLRRQVLSSWLSDLTNVQKRLEELFFINEKNLQVAHGASYLYLPCRNGMIAQCLYRRLLALAAAVSESSPSTPMMELLVKGNSMVGLFYRTAFRARKTSDERFAYLAEKSLNAAIEESFTLPTEILVRCHRSSLASPSSLTLLAFAAQSCVD